LAGAALTSTRRRTTVGTLLASWLHLLEPDDQPSEISGEPLRDRLDQYGLPRRRASVRPGRAIQRQTQCWAAKRQARLAELGFADVEDYLQVWRVEQGSSLRHMLTELQVGSAWLKGQMDRAGHPLTLSSA
jgi:hypothetical protein